MAALIIYILAGLGFCWALVHNNWWQKVLVIPLWLPLIGWAMICDFIDWWNQHRYEYSETESNNEGEPKDER